MEITELASGSVVRERAFTYDSYGRVVEVEHTGGNEYTTSIIWEEPYAVENILSIPNEITVVSNNEERRKRVVDAFDPNTGDILAVSVFFTDTEFNTTEMTYDTYGNLLTIQYPQPATGDALERTYTYSATLHHQYVTEISDNYGFTSTADYDPRYGHPLATTDLTGNTMVYTYDTKGRLSTIKGPKDPNYTIRNGYTLSVNKKSWATTEHYDVQHSAPIKTLTISNGMGEPVQVKKNVEIWENDQYTMGMSVSGIIVKDAWGRAIEQYHPTFTANLGNPEFILNAVGVPQSRTEYDALDRPIVQFDGANTPTVYSYGIDDGRLHTSIEIQIDQNLTMTRESWKDIDDRLRQSRTNDKITQYRYDGIGQLLEVEDEENNITLSEYDWAGRLITWTHPDAGTTTYTYDDLGQMRSMTTANLAAKNQEVTYEYDGLGRIISAAYPPVGPPANPQENVNNVLYRYYDANDSNPNNRGRLHQQEDATGMQEYEYGNMGEVVRHTRTMVNPVTPAYQTFEQTFEYDSWHRIQSMTYPGGEVVTYTYDRGGNLKSMSSTEQEYISEIGYDHFEQKVYCKYGNGTKNHYTYTPDLRRLDRMQALTSSDLHMYDNTYTFDLVGNILGLDNAASPVNGMGGGYSHGFSYDAFNRLAGATGSWLNAADNNYQLTMGYEGMHRIQSKHQQHNLNANPVAENDYQHTYLYEHPTKPNALTSIVANGQESETFTYDLNGNVLHHNRVGGESRRVVWDELTYPKGRMSGGHSVSEPSAPARGLHKAINIADAAVQHHLYDAQGERGLKGLGTITEFYVNGETKGYGASLGNYVRYVSGYFVVDGHGRVSKHYYAGAERVVSRLAGDVAGYLEAEDLEGEQLSTLRSRQQRDVQAAIKTWDLQIFPFLNYPKPTDNCSLYPSGSEDHKQCICDQQNTCTEVLYWYHPDHLGSSTFLSDAAGEPYQFVLYLPFGELFAEQRAAEWSTPYLFNAKELDTETGLYYYGARYYDPRVSTWWGVDPLAGEMLAWSSYAYTFQNPVRYIDPTGMIPEEGDSPKNEYIRFKNSEGKWVTVEISKLGGDEYDVIRTQHGNVPDKGSWVETTTHYNSDRLGRIEPGQFGERPPDAALEFFDISDLIPTKGGAKFTLGLAMGGFFKKSGKDLSKVVLQSGGQSLKPGTLEALKLSKEQGRDAIHLLKSEKGLPNNFHGRIMANGDYIDPSSGRVIDNLYKYLE